MKSSMPFSLVVLMLLTTTPVAEAQTNILASATRLASTAELAQDDSTIRRMRSRGFAGLGVGLIATGVALFVGPPECGRVGEGITQELLGATYRYENRYREGRCDVGIDVRRPDIHIFTLDSSGQVTGDFSVPPGTHREYVNDINSGGGFYVLPSEIDQIQVTQSNTRRYIGLAIAGGGGFLLWYGLSRIEVPFRVDLTPGGGVLASHSFGW